MNNDSGTNSLANELEIMTNVNPRMASTIDPPVMEARRWLEEFPPECNLGLVNLSQAAPVQPPPESLRKAIAQFALEDDLAHTYGPVLGLTGLREEIALQWSSAYQGDVSEVQVAITSGCNQAFTAAVSALADNNDAIILALPWYFNHKMWLDMTGIEARLLDCGPDMIPRACDAEKLVGPEVRAIALVTPNNPSGAEYPANVVHEFFELARDRGIALVLDETYRNFDSRDESPHQLFSNPDWPETLVHLYSFSKAYRLTGHRVGAMIASEKLLRQVEKFLDTVSICPNQLAQRAALFGLRNLEEWLAGERLEILRRRVAIEAGFRNLPGWKLLGCGAYFAYVEHPFEIGSDDLVKRMIQKINVLALPGTMFAPAGRSCGQSMPESQLRIAFANVDVQGIEELFARLSQFSA